MLQEMRLVLRLHREPGMDDRVPTAAQVLQMATEHGAQTTGFAGLIGTLEPGKAADLVLMPWHHLAIRTWIQRSQWSMPWCTVESVGVETVLVAGVPVLRDGQVVRVAKAAVLEELAAALRQPLNAEEIHRQQLRGTSSRTCSVSTMAGWMNRSESLFTHERAPLSGRT